MTDTHTTRTLISARWGMPQEQYALAYGTGKAQPEWLGDVRYERVLSEIKKVSAVGQGGLCELNDISIVTLRSILHYSYSPNNYLDLVSPALIGGCIRVMSGIRLADKFSPFSYEIGYVCFRIVAITLAVSMLQRGAELGMRMGEMIMKPDSRVPTEDTITIHLTRLIQDLAKHIGGKGKDGYNCILGWSACPEHPKSPALVSLSDASTLLNILYEDRRVLLKASGSLCPTGISAVIVLLWRYLAYQRCLVGYQGTRQHAVQLQEVLWRCFLITTTREQESFASICGREEDLWPGHKAEISLPVELEDSKMLINAFINRLQLAGKQPRRALLFLDLLNSLAFVKQHFLPGCQNLMGRCLGALIEQIWCALERKEKSDFKAQSDLDIPDAFGRFIDLFSETIVLLLQWRNNIVPATIEQIIEEIIRTELLDLMGRIIFLLNPTMDDNPGSSDFQTNAHVMKGSQKFLGGLSKLATIPILEARFEFYATNWRKISQQLSQELVVE